MTVLSDVIIRVLGPVSASADGEVVGLGGPMQHRLLALLAAASPEAVSVSSLVTELWPDNPPSDPNRTVRNLVSRLRSAAGEETVVTTAGGYRLGPVSLDADQFEELVRSAWAATGSLAAVGRWNAALSLWQGRAFDGYEDLPSVTARAQGLEELRSAATEAWLEARFEAGERSELLADLEDAAAHNPLRETPRRLQMMALAAMGRRPDALRSFQRFRRNLIDVGLEPSAELVEIERRIATGEFRPSTPVVNVRGYRIEAELGRDRFSTVYRARQPALDRLVAIKVIRGDVADRPEFIAQFEAEAQLIAQLEHSECGPAL